MNTTLWHAGSPNADWCKNQDKLGVHFLQTISWGKFQTALGKPTFYANGPGWSWLAMLEKSRFGTRLYCPYGPTVTFAKNLHQALVALVACAKHQQVSYIRLEPQGNLTLRDLQNLGLRQARRNMQPSLTWIKRLDKSEDELIAEMSATNRNLHRTAGTKGLSFRASTNPKEILTFLDMLHEVANRNAITAHPDGYYQRMAEVLMPMGALTLYFAEHEGKPVAASVVFDSSTTRYYAHAASRTAARKLHPGSPLVSRMILDAKHKGQKQFDFYGIAPPGQPNHPWAGFTQFKQSFGGEAHDLHGTWELPIKKMSYVAYRTIGKIIKK